MNFFPFLANFSSQFGLARGTAIALHVGHRKSIDFDLFSTTSFNNLDLERKILSRKQIEQVLVNQEGEYTLVVDGVKVTFLYYPFNIEFKESFSSLPVADLLTLSALKAYALGRRPKWKDYVDLYFIFKYHSIEQVINQAQEIFQDNFNEKIFKAQLAYFEDIDYSEEIDYLPGQETEQEKIKQELTELSLS